MISFNFWKSCTRCREPSFFLMKNTGAPIGDLDGQMCPFAKFSLRNSSSSFCSVGRGGKSFLYLGVRMELYGMIPCLMRGEVGEVFVAFWDCASRWAGSLGLSLLCQSLRGG